MEAKPTMYTKADTRFFLCKGFLHQQQVSLNWPWPYQVLPATENTQMYLKNEDWKAIKFLNHTSIVFTECEYRSFVIFIHNIDENDSVILPFPIRSQEMKLIQLRFFIIQWLSNEDDSSFWFNTKYSSSIASCYLVP